MLKSAKSRAEQQFTATQKKDKRALEEKELARQERAKHVAKLRGLRLAKEASDKKAADEIAAEKATKAAEKTAAKKKKSA